MLLIGPSFDRELSFGTAPVDEKVASRHDFRLTNILQLPLMLERCVPRRCQIGCHAEPMWLLALVNGVAYFNYVVRRAAAYHLDDFTLECPWHTLTVNQHLNGHDCLTVWALAILTL